MVDAMLDELREIFTNRHVICNEFKRKGHKFIGWVCTYIPEEILHAGGLTPIRVLGGEGETPTADAHLYTNICTFCRNALEEAFKGKYDYLEGFVALNACDHIRRLYDVWSIYLKNKTPFNVILSVPGKISENTLKVFAEELEVFKDRIEKHFGVKITDEALNNSISVYDKMRTLLREIYELRMDDAPKVTGSEAMDIVLAGMVIPKEEFIKKLEPLLEALKKREPIKDAENRIRLLITGSEMQVSGYIKFIEDLGGLVVMDYLCTGSRYFWNLVERDGSPIEAIARRYLTRNPCPRIRPQTERVNRLKEMVRDFKVQGIIFETLKFCDMHGTAYPIIKRAMAEIDIPVLRLEREHVLSGLGQIRTRTQAFFESIGV